MSHKGTASRRPVKGDGGKKRPQAELDRQSKVQTLSYVAQIITAVAAIAELIKAVL